MVKWFDRLKRTLCCFPLKRRHSDCELLNSGNSVYNTTTRRRSEEAVNHWDPRDDVRRTIDQHIELYRTKLFLQSTQTTATVAASKEPDYFQDMTPEITKQTKFLLQSDRDDIATKFSRLEAAPAIAVDLEDWNDGNQSRDAWEELDDTLINNLIRERRNELNDQQ